MTHVLMPDDLNIFVIGEWERELGPVRGTRVGAAADARDLGCTLYELDPPGQAAPYHAPYTKEEGSTAHPSSGRRTGSAMRPKAPWWRPRFGDQASAGFQWHRNPMFPPSSAAASDAAPAVALSGAVPRRRPGSSSHRARPHIGRAARSSANVSWLSQSATSECLGRIAGGRLPEGTRHRSAARLTGAYALPMHASGFVGDAGRIRDCSLRVMAKARTKALGRPPGDASAASVESPRSVPVAPWGGILSLAPSGEIGGELVER
jgi:hypothetical protein